MWGNGDTCVLRVRGMQTTIDILVLSEIKSVYNLWTSKEHKIEKNYYELPHGISPDMERKSKWVSSTGSWRSGI